MLYESFTNTTPINTAEELWEMLSPTRDIFAKPCKLIYRGQANAEWSLIPSVLRSTYSIDRTDIASKIIGSKANSNEQIQIETILLQKFAEFCDQIGIRIPNDSIEFRETILRYDKQDSFHKNPPLWPNDKLFEIMALAQHHGVPTRLLDWTRQPYVAAYFAASTALSNQSKWKSSEQLAIWVLNIELIKLYPKVKILKTPSSITPHLSAQSGLFTVHPHNGSRGGEFEVRGLEEEFSKLPNSPLLKITLPIEQSCRLLELCEKAGFTGATIYPTADGAGKAVIDSINIWAYQRKLKQ